MDEKRDDLPKEETKTAWQQTKEGWYDKVPLTVQQLDIIIWCGIGGLILGGPLVMGYIAVILTIVRGGEPKVEKMFENFSGRFVSNMALFVLQYLYTFLWSMLFIIPGIVKSYSYAMAYYIQCDNPEMGANEAITRSREMMNGHKWQLFCLHFSFFGWILLSVLTCGLLLIMVTPYMNAATAEFYEKLKRDELIAKGIDPDATEATFEEAPVVEEAPAIESATEETN